MEIKQLNTLIHNIMNGDKESYRQLIVFYQDMVYGLCYKHLQSENDASEVTQDVFVKAYLSLNQFQFKSGFNTWLYRIAYNMCIDFHRKKKRQENKIDHIKHHQTEDPEQPNEDRDLKAIIDNLPENYRDVLLLFYYQELSYKEISTIMDITIDNVKILLFRAKKKLKMVLENEGTVS